MPPRKFFKKTQKLQKTKKSSHQLRMVREKNQKQFWNPETISNKNPTRDFDISTKSVICITLMQIHARKP